MAQNVDSLTVKNTSVLVKPRLIATEVLFSLLILDGCNLDTPFNSKPQEFLKTLQLIMRTIVIPG